MQTPMNENKQAGESVLNNLMQLNKLTYRVPPSLSVAKERRYVSNYPQQRNYGNGQTLVWNCNTGAQFIDGKRSYFTFKLDTLAASEAEFGAGSCANLFRSIRVKSRSGVEISRLEGANLWSHVWQRWNCPPDAFETTLTAQGYGNQIVAAATTLGAGGAKFVFPLYLIPCFNQSGGRLLPAQLMDGCIIEIELQTPEAAFLSTGPNPTSFTLSECEIRWDAYQLSDAVARKINEMAARDGLNLVHKEYYRTLVSGNQQEYQYDIKKSCSKALGVYACPRNSSAINAFASDSVNLQQQDVVRYQFQIGAVYHPSSPMTNASAGVAPTNQTGSEAYYYSLASWHRTDCHKPSDVSLARFIGDGTAVKMGIASTSLCKSQVSDLAGVMVNSARALNVDIQCSAAAARRIDTYLCHARLVKVFLENAVVSD